MKSTEQHGAPVRVEQSDPDLVAAVAKAKEIMHGEDVREVSRLEGLIINERAAHKMLSHAAETMEVARLNYHEALDLYIKAVKLRKEEEGYDG